MKETERTLHRRNQPAVKSGRRAWAVVQHFVELARVSPWHYFRWTLSGGDAGFDEPTARRMGVQPLMPPTSPAPCKQAAVLTFLAASTLDDGDVSLVVDALRGADLSGELSPVVRRAVGYTSEVFGQAAASLGWADLLDVASDAFEWLKKAEEAAERAKSPEGYANALSNAREELERKMSGLAAIIAGDPSSYRDVVEAISRELRAHTKAGEHAEKTGHRLMEPVSQRQLPCIVDNPEWRMFRPYEENSGLPLLVSLITIDFVDDMPESEKSSLRDEHPAQTKSLLESSAITYARDTEVASYGHVPVEFMQLEHGGDVLARWRPGPDAQAIMRALQGGPGSEKALAALEELQKYLHHPVGEAFDWHVAHLATMRWAEAGKPIEGPAYVDGKPIAGRSDRLDLEFDLGSLPGLVKELGLVEPAASPSAVDKAAQTLREAIAAREAFYLQYPDPKDATLVWGRTYNVKWLSRGRVRVEPIGPNRPGYAKRLRYLVTQGATSDSKGLRAARRLVPRLPPGTVPMFGRPNDHPRLVVLSKLLLVHIAEADAALIDDSHAPMSDADLRRMAKVARMTPEKAEEAIQAWSSGWWKRARGERQKVGLPWLSHNDSGVTLHRALTDERAFLRDGALKRESGRKRQRARRSKRSKW